MADDVTPYVARSLRHAVSEVTRYAGKKRFIAEYSGWSRIGFFNAIFPGAKFIHIVRDGRAVANSYTNTQWWRGWHGVHQWRWGVPSPELLGALDKYDRSFLALAGIHWKLLVNNILDASEYLPSTRTLVVRYEDLVREPYEVAFQCLDFLGLEKNGRRYKRHLSTVKVVDANNTTFRIAPWRENVSAKQVDMLNELLGEELTRLGYK